MKKYTCPNSPEHDGVYFVATCKNSPHNGQILCAECDEHIKWATRREMTELDTGGVHTLNEADAEDAVICPLMSGIVTVPPRSDMYPSRLRFESAACMKTGCAWWINERCAIVDLSQSLGVIADWSPR